MWIASVNVNTHTQDTIGSCLWCSRLIEKVPSVLARESLIRRVRRSQRWPLPLVYVQVALVVFIFISVFSANELSFKCATMFFTDCSCCFSCTLSAVKRETQNRMSWQWGRKEGGWLALLQSQPKCSRSSALCFNSVLFWLQLVNIIYCSTAEAKVLCLLYDFSLGDFCCSSGRGSVTKRREKANVVTKKKWKQNFDVDAQPESKLEIYKCAVARVSNTWLSPLSPPLHSEPLYFCTHNSSLFTVNCVQIYFPCTRCVYLFHFMRNFSLCASGQKLCMSNESICSVPASHSRYLSRDPVVSCRVLLCCCWQLQFNWVITPVPGTARDKLTARCELPTHIPYG